MQLDDVSSLTVSESHFLVRSHPEMEISTCDPVRGFDLVVALSLQNSDARRHFFGIDEQIDIKVLPQTDLPVSVRRNGQAFQNDRGDVRFRQ